MRAPLALLFSSLLAGVSATAQTAPASVPPSAANANPASTAAGGTVTYRNPTLHLAYTYPSNYLDASGTVGPAFQASVGQADGSEAGALRCITLPFSAMNTSAGLSLVLLVRADAACAKKTYTAAQLPEFTRGEVQGLSASGAKPQFGEPVSFTTAGHPAEFLQGSFSLPTGQKLHAMVACVLLKPDIACFQFIGSSDDNLRTMSTFPVSLDGGPAQPVVPAGALTKP